MEIAVVDITGRNAAQYNPSLCKALSSQNKGGNVSLYSPTHDGIPEGYNWIRLISLVPKSMISSSSRIKRLLRAFGTVLNYFYITILLFFSKPQIIHFQWLPFVEFSGLESFFLGFVSFVNPKAKIILTVHNIYPHLTSEKDRDIYANRFKALDKYIDGYIVHLQSTKPLLEKEFSINEEKIFLAYHGIYKAVGYDKTEKTIDHNKIKIILYGYQHKYKGADLFIEALKRLPISYLQKTESLIIGRTDLDLYSQYEKDLSSVNVTWINRFVSDEELYDAIGEADLILLPYKQITQSGVLLLALSYMKPILTSNLPSFKETLEGYPDDYFFKANDANSLSLILQHFIDGKIDVDVMKVVIARLNKKYSWEETAKRTIHAYNNLI